jgi:3-hydroxyacyl-[acyl-carrier protein] dehydratase / trans-2-decenoyl-[acyl-carrier protein] isomerase
MPDPRHAFSHDEVIELGTGTCFSPDSPRMPLPNMLMVSRIVRVAEGEGKYGKGLVVAELDIHPELWFFQCHFQGDPVMPGCLGLDAMWQLTGFYVAWLGLHGKGRALGVKEVKFSGQVLPENRLVRYVIDMKRVINRRLVMAIADGRVEVDGKPIYHATDLRIGLFIEDAPS